LAGKRRQEYIEDLEKQIAFLSKGEDVKLQQHRSALQAANDKNLQLSAVIVKLAEQLKEESRLRIQEEANEIVLPEIIELDSAKAMASSEAFETEKRHSDM
jgi:protein subunit release factor B